MCGIIKTNLTVIPQTSYMLPKLVLFTFVRFESYIYSDGGLISFSVEISKPKISLRNSDEQEDRFSPSVTRSVKLKYICSDMLRSFKLL
jgi:hypothetical protein